jgi:hypothetical protein
VAGIRGKAPAANTVAIRAANSLVMMTRTFRVRGLKMSVQRGPRNRRLTAWPTIARNFLPAPRDRFRLLDAIARLTPPTRRNAISTAAAAASWFANTGRWTPTRPSGCSPASSRWRTPSWPPARRPSRAAGPRWPPASRLNLVFQQRDEVRAQTRLLSGSVPEPPPWPRTARRYKVHLLRGFNHGLFLDMAEGRRWVRAQAAARPGLTVLNLFAYTCAFSVAALQGGAGRVVNVDMAAGALIARPTRPQRPERRGQLPAARPVQQLGQGGRGGPTTWSSPTRPATRRAASWPRRTTPACCAACPSC